jgi:uncharacterized protein (TIGR02118 family)
MEQLAIGLWRTAGTPLEQVHAALLGEWAAAALDHQGTLALTINVADADQGRFTNEPDANGNVPNADAFIVLGLDRAHDLDDVPARDLLHHVARHVDVWRIIANERKTAERVTEDGEPSPGVKMVSFMTRAEGLSHEQFVRHWTERHTPLALRHHVGLWNYTQNVVRRSYTPGGRGVDGIAELHFRTRDDFENRFFDSDEGRDAIRTDVKRFMTQGASSAALVTEFILRSPR